MAVSEEVIRKHLDDVFCKVFDELKEAMGENILNENADWLTHNAWLELGVCDIRMTTEAVECHAELIEALREEASAKRRLKEANARASKAYISAITTMSRLTAEFNDKRQKVQSGLELFKNNTAALVNSPAVHNATAHDDPPKENHTKPKFDPFDVQAVRANAPQLRSQMSRRIMAEARNGSKAKTKAVDSKIQPPPVLGVSRRQDIGVPRADDSRSVGVEGSTKLLNKVSKDGSFTDELDSTERDSELPLPPAPNFDDDEPTSFFSNNQSVSINKDESAHGRVPSTSLLKAPPQLRHKPLDDDLLIAPKAPVLRSKAVQNFLGAHASSTSSTMHEFSNLEFESLDEKVQLHLTRDSLNNAVRMLNASHVDRPSLMSIARHLEGAYSMQQCDAVYSALKNTHRIPF